MIVSLADMKTYLGISDNTQDAFLTEQLELVQAAVEGYCGRKFELGTYSQIFYPEDIDDNGRMLSYGYPIRTITSIERDEVELEADQYRIHKTSGTILLLKTPKPQDSIVFEYTAGFLDAQMPAPIKAVIKTLVQERYNKKSAGVALSFGSDVQSVTIPGTISIAFDYTLQSNERASAFGNILGNNLNILDYYRSERVIVGPGTISYVEVT